MSGLRTWLRSLLRKPVLLFHEQIDEVRNEIHHDVEVLHDDIQHRARRLEVTVATWGITAALLVVCGLFMLMGFWLGLSEFVGPVGASFALAALFGLLAAAPLFLLPKELARVDAPYTPRSK